MLRSLSVVIASRRRRALVTVGLAGVMAVTGGWIVGSDGRETKVAAGSNDAPPALADTTLSLIPGDEPVETDPSSTTTSPRSSPSSGPSTTTSVALPDTTTTSTTAPTAPLVGIDTVQPPIDEPCGAPRIGHVHHNGPVPPLASDWRTIPAAPIAARLRHAAVWTGHEMIVWGGWSGAFTSNSDFGDGAAYDPASGTWRVLPAAPLKPRMKPAMVWTGRETVVVGVGDLDSAAYDPVKNCWRRIADSPLAQSTLGFGTAVTGWTGDRVIAWNGQEVATWDPVNDTWAQFPSPPQGNQCLKPGTWVGGRLMVWWAPNHDCNLFESQEGAAFDPATKAWVPIPIPQDVVLSDSQAPAIWTGREMLIAGFSRGENSTWPTTWFALDPDTARWRTVAQPSHWEPWQTAVWSGAEMILWGGIQGGPSNTYAYDPVQDRWRDADHSPFEGRNGHSAVWTGTEMIVWGGQGSNPSSCEGGQEFKLASCDGGAYRPD